MWDNTDVEEFVKSLIDTILDNAEDENIAWNWGEETLRVDYIINLINDLANMDYKHPYPKAENVLCVIIIIIDIRKASTEIIVLESAMDAMILTVYLHV